VTENAFILLSRGDWREPCPALPLLAWMILFVIVYCSIMSSPVSTLVPALVLRNLADRSYEKRKQAALEIEHLIKELNAQGPNKVANAENIKGIITLLVRDFAYSTQSNNRKGTIKSIIAAICNT
jgi:hypothetical protein